MAEYSSKGPKPPIKCWGCGVENLLQECTRKGNKGANIHNIQESTTIKDVARSIPLIYASLDNRYADN